jgi:hypothetical protein
MLQAYILYLLDFSLGVNLLSDGLLAGHCHIKSGIINVSYLSLTV